MSLQDRADACDEIVRWIAATRFTSVGWPTARSVATRTQDVRAAATRWTGQVLAAPAGRPDDVRASAGAYTTAAARLDADARALEGAAGDLDAAFDAAVGVAGVQALHAVVDLSRLEARGCRVLATALRGYATALEGAQESHASAAAVLTDAHGDAVGREAPSPWDDLDPDECRTLLGILDDILERASTAARQCGDAFRAAIEAEHTLRLALADAAGYARLAGFVPSGGVSALDAAMTLAAGVDDPDKAVVSPAEWEAYLAARDGLTDQERARFDATLADARTPQERQAIVSALAMGVGLPLVLALARRLRDLTPQEVQAVASLGLHDVGSAASGAGLTAPDGTRLVQMTGTTCGSSSLLMLAAQRDPYLALFLATGELVDGHVPGYLEDVPMIDLVPGAGLTTTERITYVQEQVRIQTNKFTLWPGTWLGSAPWGYGDEVSRILGGQSVDMSYRLTGPAQDAGRLVEQAVAAVDAGTPVPFLVGPQGTNVPRHYVLLVGHTGSELQFYEPGSGEVRSVSIDDAVAGDGPVGAFGNWDAIYGAAIPQG